MATHDELCDRAAEIASAHGEHLANQRSGKTPVTATALKQIGELTAYSLMFEDALACLGEAEAQSVLKKAEVRLKARGCRLPGEEKVA